MRPESNKMLDQLRDADAVIVTKYDNWEFRVAV